MWPSRKYYRGSPQDIQRWVDEPFEELAFRGALFGPFINGVREIYDIEARIRRLEDTAPPDQRWQITLASIEGSVLATGFAYSAEAGLAALFVPAAATLGFDKAVG